MRHRKLFVLSLFLVLANFIEAQQTTFQKSFGEVSNDNCYSVHESARDEYFALGHSTSFSFAGTYLVKMDSVGNMLWSKIYRVQIAPGGDDAGYQMMDANDGGFYVFGVTDGGSTGDEEFVLFKIDSLGNPLWAKSYGNANGDSNGFGFDKTSDGGFIMTGNAAEMTGGWDIYLVRADSLGNFLWSADYSSQPNMSEEAYAVKQTRDGGFVLAGYTEGFGAGSRDAYVLKTDSAGNLLWSKTYGGIYDDRAVSILEMNDGSFMVGGVTGYGAGGNDVFQMKTDSAGNELWTHTFGGPSGEDAHSMEMTDDGGFIFAGSTDLPGNGQSEFLLFKTDSMGNLAWAKTLGGPQFENAYDAVQTNDKGFIIGGSSTTFGATNSGDWNFYVVKTDKSGVENCSETIPAIVQNNVMMTQTSPPTNDTFPPWPNESQIVVANVANTIDSTVCYINGIHETAYQNAVAVFPNPSNGIFHLEINNPGSADVKIEIADVLGKIIYSNEMKSGKSEIDLGDAAEGIYFFRIFNENTTVSTGKILIQR